MKDVKFIIGRIKGLSQEKNISINKLLSECKLNPSLVSDMQRKGTIPSIKAISKIAEYFDVSIDYLIGNCDFPADQPIPVSLSKSAFNKRLQELRTEHGISQAALSKELGVAQSTVGMWESGKREPDYDTLVKIAGYFEVSTDYLLGNQKHISVSALSETTSVFGQMLRQLRENQHIMQKDMAQILKIGASTLSQYETGKREADYETLVRIAKYFHVSVDYLLGNQLTPDSENPNKSKDSSLTQKQIQAFSNEIQAAIDKLLKSLQKEDEV